MYEITAAKGDREELGDEFSSAGLVAFLIGAALTLTFGLSVIGLGLRNPRV